MMEINVLYLGYQCQHPGCDIVLQLCKILLCGEAELRVHRISLYYLSQLHIFYNDLKIEFNKKKKPHTQSCSLKSPSGFPLFLKCEIPDAIALSTCQDHQAPSGFLCSIRSDSLSSPATPIPTTRGLLQMLSLSEPCFPLFYLTPTYPSELKRSLKSLGQPFPNLSKSNFPISSSCSVLFSLVVHTFTAALSHLLASSLD